MNKKSAVAASGAIVLSAVYLTFILNVFALNTKRNACISLAIFVSRALLWFGCASVLFQREANTRD